MDWINFINRLRKYPKGMHILLPPCPDEEIKNVQAVLGKMPDPLTRMLRHFNGAQLFCTGLPLVSIFGLSVAMPDKPMEWCKEWSIDKFTPKWRAFPLSNHEWAFAMNNYGGLLVVDLVGMTAEWDTSERRWLGHKMSFEDRFEQLIQEGDICLRELGES